MDPGAVPKGVHPMTDGFRLYIGNKNYSSWSFRPWIALRVADIDFEERLVPFDFSAGNHAFRAFSPSGRVPVLEHGTARVWESLAIIDYVADLMPDRQFWPDKRDHRAMARSIAAEMHSGFAALRGACPMNMRRPRGAIETDQSVAVDVARIEQLWRDALELSGGPFLFGDFGAADAMYAPVVNRLDVYALTEDADALSYMKSVKALPQWQEWEAAGRAEPWIVAEDEA